MTVTLQAETCVKPLSRKQYQQLLDNLKVAAELEELARRRWAKLARTHGDFSPAARIALGQLNKAKFHTSIAQDDLTTAYNRAVGRR